MKTLLIRSLGYNIGLPSAESVEEYDRLAKRIGACLDDANKNTAYRVSLAAWRGAFTEELESITKISRKTRDTGKVRKSKVEAADGTVTETEEAILVWDETEADFEARVIATVARDEGVAPDVIKTRFQEVADRIAAKMVFDPSESEKAPAGPKKIAQAYLVAAQRIIDAGKAATVAATLTAKLGITVTTELESLARGVAEDQARKRKEIDKDYV